MNNRGQDAPGKETIQQLPVAAAAAAANKSSLNIDEESASFHDTFSSSTSKPIVEARGPSHTFPNSRSISPDVTKITPVGTPPESLLQPRSRRDPLDSSIEDTSEPVRSIIQAFVPHVSVYTSEGVETMMAEKGFRRGLWELLRPFGEKVQGKVLVRNNHGSSRSYEDFAIRFTRLGQGMDSESSMMSDLPRSAGSDGLIIADGPTNKLTARDDGILAVVESLAERDLAFAEKLPARTSQATLDASSKNMDAENPSSYWPLYLRRLLASTPLTSYESFAHPVAGVIAINSSSANPVEHFRRLYEETNEGSKRLPPWASNDYLRYYVLVHDEDNEDITRSMALFEQMKRHLGLHCHLLRLRCTKSIETDDDSMPLPDCKWMPSAEELERGERGEDEDDLEAPMQYIFESDATAIRTFIREMVTQSIIPTMERQVAVWNDQVASRRRGIAGRFMNLSRKWAGFGSGNRVSNSGNSTGEVSYEEVGYYRFDTAEATMRKLADYAFMLRDWKLSHSTYDLLRSEFSESKAWKHHAAVNEMAAISMLLLPQLQPSKIRSPVVDQMLESAFYSYFTRCGLPFGAARCLLVGLELLRIRGGNHADDAGRWGLRLLESKILGPIGETMLKERLCVCYSSKLGLGTWGWGSRHRKAALWSLLAAEAWNQQGKYVPASKCLSDTDKICRQISRGSGLSRFAVAQLHVTSLQLALSKKAHVGDEQRGDDDANDLAMDVEDQTFTTLPYKRSRAGSRANPLETAPLHDVTTYEEPHIAQSS